MAYIDANVIPVPTAAKDAYVAHIRTITAIFKELGATDVVDAWGDDVPDGKRTDFKRAVAATADETVVVAWIVWPDKATRNAGWEKWMADPRMQAMNPPFEGSRMIYGGFEKLA